MSNQEKQAEATVSFRMPRGFPQLAKMAEESGNSPGVQARSLVLESLNDTKQLELLSAIGALQADLQELRSDLGWVLANVLVTVAGTDKEIARGLVARRFPASKGM